MVDLEFLRQVGLFKGLEDDDLLRLQACCQERVANRDERIFQGGGAKGEGDHARFVYVLVTGEIALRFDLPMRETGADTTVLVIEPGKSFGWSALVPPYRYSLSAYCTSTTAKMLAFKRECLLSLFDEFPKIGYVIMTNLGKVISKRFFGLQEEYAIQMGHRLMRW